MALEIQKQTPIAITANYWRIISTQCDYDALQIVVFLAGYPSHEARQAGGKPMIQDQVTFAGADFINGNRDAIYTSVKALPAWSTALDV